MLANSIDLTAKSDSELRRLFLTSAHGIANVSWLVLMHVLLIGWLWWSYTWLGTGAWLLTSAFAAVTHQRILSEWLHEASHWNLWPERKWNDRLTDLLIGSFIGTRVADNRAGHFRHHAVSSFFNEDDPDTRDQAARNRGELLAGLARDISGITMVGKLLRKSAMQVRKGGPRQQIAWYGWLVLLHFAGFSATLYYQRPLIYPLFFASMLCLYPLADRCRLYGQHAEYDSEGRAHLNGSRASRTFHSGLLGQILLNSPMIMYHHEHHARPNLPYRALRAISEPDGNMNAFGRSSLQVSRAVVASLS